MNKKALKQYFLYDINTPNVDLNKLLQYPPSWILQLFYPSCYNYANVIQKDELIDFLIKHAPDKYIPYTELENDYIMNNIINVYGNYIIETRMSLAKKIIRYLNSSPVAKAYRWKQVLKICGHCHNKFQQLLVDYLTNKCYNLIEMLIIDSDTKQFREDNITLLKQAGVDIDDTMRKVYKADNTITTSDIKDLFDM